MSENETRRDERTITRKRPKTQKPRMWRVVFHNDDYTTMEFVVMVLMKHFQKSLAEATQVMLQVHHKGSGIAGVYTRDEAETKVSVVIEEAESSGMPLKLTAEPE
jgi:ATP-dependent Clp protease adaptor protein ClpS